MIAGRPDKWAGLRAAPLALLLGVGVLAAAFRGGSYDPIARGELFVAILWILALAVAFGLLPRYRVPRGAAIAVASLAGLGVWLAIGLAWTESDERTLVEVARTLGFAGLLLLVVWTFGEPERELAAGVLAAAGVIVCVAALGSRLAPDIVPSDLPARGLYRRLGHPLNYWNALGSWAAMTCALALALSAHARTRWSRGAALAGVSIAVPVAYLTYSRSAAIAVPLAVLAVAVLSRHRWQIALNATLAAAGSAAVIGAIRLNPEISRGTGTRGAATVATVAVVVAGVAVLAGRTGLTGYLDGFHIRPRASRALLVGAATVFVVGAVAIGPRLADDAWSSFARRPEQRAVSDPSERLGNLSGVRYQLWGAALDAFEAHPLRGTGGGTYELVWNRDVRHDTAARDAHSLYVETLAETGVPGLLLLVLGLGSLLVTALRAPSRQRDAAAAGAATGCAAALLVFCVTAGVDWLWELTAVTVLGLVCGGLAAGGTAVAVRLAVPVRSGATAVVVVMLATQLPGLVTAAQIGESRRAIAQSRVQDAVSAATTAIDAQPWAASGYLQRALVLERTGMLRAAALDAERAAHREPTNWQHWLILGRIQAERGRIEAALRAAERARALNPRSLLFHPPP